MKIHRPTLIAILSSAVVALATQSAKPDRARLDRIQRTFSNVVPRLLCLDENFATGAQPTADAAT
jgi:hypothetical protein